MCGKTAGSVDRERFAEGGTITRLLSTSQSVSLIIEILPNSKDSFLSRCHHRVAGAVQDVDSLVKTVARPPDTTSQIVIFLHKAKLDHLLMGCKRSMESKRLSHSYCISYGKYSLSFFILVCQLNSLRP
jgi:hypothetical protein